MEKALNFKKDIASYINSLMKLPNADKVVRQYERGLITLDEALASLKDNEIDILKAENKVNRGEGVCVYGMRLRPADISCQPTEGYLGRLNADEINFLRGDEISRYYDIISYNRKLSEDEVKHFALDYLGALVA